VEEILALGPAFERCALIEPSGLAPIAVQVVIRPGGRVIVAAIPRSSEVPGVDACVAEVLRTAEVDARSFRVEGVVSVRFLQALRSGDPEDAG
jgi:hypothetical protein